MLKMKKPDRDNLLVAMQPFESEFRYVGYAENVEDAITSIANLKPDLVFLDIQIPSFNVGKNALSIIETLKVSGAHMPLFIGLSSHNYGKDALNTHRVIHYLDKPIIRKELKESLDYFKLALPPIKNLEIKTKKELPEYIPVERILRFEASNNYTHIYLITGRCITASKNLGYYEEKVRLPNSFIQTHRSHIINANYFTKFSKVGNITICILGFNGKTERCTHYKRRICRN